MGLVIGVIALLTTVAAFILGIVGFVGGVQRRAAGTIIMAALGVLLNGFLLYSTITVILMLRNRGA